MEPSSAPWRVIEDDAPGGASGTRSEAPSPDRRWALLAVAVVAVAIAAGVLVVAARQDPPVAAAGLPDPAASGDAAQGSVGPSGDPGSAGGPSGGASLVVEVSGAVIRPGLYRLPAGSRVGDAITAAGGYGPRVDPVAADRALNLAQRLQDGDKIHVPSRDEAAASPGASGGAGSGGGSGGTGIGSGGTAGSGGGLVDLNHASAAALDALPGIGPVTAAKIIAARTERPFRTLDELVTRKVLGQAALAKIRALVTVGG